MIRTIAEARLLQSVEVAEFDALRIHRGDIIAVAGNTCYRLSWEVPNARTRVAMPGGLVGFARTVEAEDHGGKHRSDLPSEAVNMHFCAHSPMPREIPGVLHRDAVSPP